MVRRKKGRQSRLRKEKDFTKSEKKLYPIGSYFESRKGEGVIIDYLPRRRLLVEYDDGERRIHSFDKRL